ncbi:hypothetical protein TL16_g01263 [Triparma laevis f. inornata]|uniref:Major facilitator superfamily (MFS) profile domain-containing protein n=1 Tax=Triparma laevis f. inornata TaxID=1714386 RepID=A0A9W7DSG2_9STRA|nr:hypothetical protein TL16_g01263 [Triparma laevis f. inornata]
MNTRHPLTPPQPYLVYSFNGTAKDIGILSAAYQFASIFAMPVTARLSDKYGRRRFFLLGFLGSAAGFLTIGLSNKIWTMIVGRFIGGMFGASMPLAQAYISDVVGTTSEMSGKLRAQLGSVFMAALIFAPGFGGGLAQFTLQTPFFVATGMAIFGFVLAYIYLTEPKKDEEEGGDDPEAAGLVDGEDTKKDKTEAENADNEKYTKNLLYIRLLWISSFLANFGFRCMITVLAPWLQYKFGWTSKEFGFLASGVGVIGIGANLIFYGKASKKFGNTFSSIMFGIGASVAWLIVASSRKTEDGGSGNFYTGPLVYLIGAVMSTTCNAIATTSNKTLLARYATPMTQGKVMGTTESINAVAGVLGPLVAGAVFDEGWQDWLPVITGVFYFFSALSVLAVYLHSKRTGHKVEKYEPKMVEFNTVMSELIFLRSRVHELEVEVETLKSRVGRKSGGEEGVGVELNEIHRHNHGNHHQMGVL